MLRRMHRRMQQGGAVGHGETLGGASRSGLIETMFR
jgi:hypothetical protein